MTDREAPIGNILVVGIGGVGGYFGGLLARHCGESGEAYAGGAQDAEGAADSQQTPRITFVARGAHLRAIQENGLLLDTAERGELLCRPDRGTEVIEQQDPPDLCLLCVKGYDLDEVSGRLASTVSANTVIMPLLNGVDIRERIPGVNRRIHASMRL